MFSLVSRKFLAMRNITLYSVPTYLHVLATARLLDTDLGIMPSAM
jgi:hypothetical protein